MHLEQPELALEVALARELTTREKLTARGMTTENAGHHRKHVLKDGVRVFEGTAWEIEQWFLTL